jgi:alkanesulfonate monooxygenase SsuD/methylene tetrahydromethanopterin reductase-like flavin-dependent oxidoreductase (luciferase family)
VKFSIAVNLERTDASQDMRQVAQDALAIVKLAEQGGFETAWATEHHTIELIVGPNPFTILMHWAAHTSRIRLGTAVVVAPYWHPIRLAGEAALFDIFSDGRLEFGIGRGAFQYEFDRMANGIEQRQGGQHMREILPVVQALWRGDTEYHGERWSFPLSTSVPKPLQSPHPPIWVAARDPDTFAWAVGMGANIMATPLSRPNAEVGILGRRFDDTLARFPDIRRPRFMMLRRACVYPRPDEWEVPVAANAHYARRFESLFHDVGGVTNGFPEPVDLALAADPRAYDVDTIRDSMVFGTPQEVVEKLKQYEAAGVDQFCYGASFGLPHAFERRSLELFITEVMPHFVEASTERIHPAQAGMTA